MNLLTLIAVVVLSLVLVIILLWNIGNRAIINRLWPVGLSKATRIETWYLYSVAGIEYYRVKKSSDLLFNDISFFLSGFKVPYDCGETNPVVLIVDFTGGVDDLQVVSSSFFLRNYQKYMTFNSYDEYEKYMNSVD